MPDRPLSFGRHFTLTYEDTLRVLQRMWPAVGVIIISAVVTQAIGIYASGFIGTKLGRGGIMLLSSFANAFVIGPYYLVLFRAVATDEVTTNAEPLRPTPAAQRFTAWLMVCYAAVFLPLLVYLAFGPDIPESGVFAPEDVTPFLAFLSLSVLGYYVALAILSVRLSTLLPLLALDPDNATFDRAMAQTKGRFWWIVGLSFVTFLPLVVVDQLVSAFTDGLDGPTAYIIGLPVSAAAAGVMVVAAIAFSTRLYQRFAADR